MKNSVSREIGEYLQFVLPIFALYAVFFLIPVARGIGYSFTDWSGLGAQMNFVGFENYATAFQDNRFVDSMGFTVYYSAIMMVMVNVVALILALLITEKLRTANSLRAIFFAPYVLNVVTVGFLWQFIFGRFFIALHEETGFFLFGINWLGNADLVAYTAAIAKTWQSVGFFMVIYIAGLQMIPRESYESAMLDGAHGWRLFRYITLPLLMPSVTICMTLSLINGMRVFPLLMSLTDGGPGRASTSIAMYLYQVAFNQFRFSYGSAIAMIFVVLVLIVTFLQLVLLKKREVQV